MDSQVRSLVNPTKANSGLQISSLHFFAVSTLNSKKRGPVPDQAGSLPLSAQEFKSVQANC